MSDNVKSEENEIVQEKVDIQKLSIIHFHGFLGNVRAVFCPNANNVKNLVYEETQKNIKVVLDRTPQELIAPKQYDAIIIDEGQDFGQDNIEENDIIQILETIIVDQEKVIEFADKHNIVIMAV